MNKYIEIFFATCVIAVIVCLLPIVLHVFCTIFVIVAQVLLVVLGLYFVITAVKALYEGLCGSDQKTWKY